MTANTVYATWLNITGTLNVASYVVEAFGSESDEGFDTDAIVHDFKDAIDDALPEGVNLVGDEFYGPVWDSDTRDMAPAGAIPWDCSPHFRVLDVDLKAAVESVDFWAIVAKHDHTA